MLIAARAAIRLPGIAPMFLQASAIRRTDCAAKISKLRVPTTARRRAAPSLDTGELY